MKYKENKNPRYEKIFYFNKVSRPKSKLSFAKLYLYLDYYSQKWKKVNRNNTIRGFIVTSNYIIQKYKSIYTDYI